MRQPDGAAASVDVWYAFVGDRIGDRESLARLLGDGERRRAGRYLFERDRTRFIVRRGMLRILLSRYTDVAPHEHVFSYSGSGKPSLAGPRSDSVSFNVSHSGDLVAVAIGSHPVGVDVEQVAPLAEVDALVDRFFSGAERAAYRTLPEDRRLRAFYAAWTRKESYLKATGEGLSVPLDSFDVSLEPSRARLLRIGEDVHPADRWSIEEFGIDDYVGAVTADAPSARVVMRPWK